MGQWDCARNYVNGDTEVGGGLPVGYRKDIVMK